MKDWENIIKKAQGFIKQALENSSNSSKYQWQAINIYYELLKGIEITDYLLTDSNPDFPKDKYIESNFNIGTLYKTIAESKSTLYITELKKNEMHRQSTNINLQEILGLFRNSIIYFKNILSVKPEDELAIKQIISVYTYMCFVQQSNNETVLKLLQEALFFSPNNETIHYNLGFIYQKLNKLDLAIIHYKLSIALLGNTQPKKQSNRVERNKILINNYNGIASIYRSIKQWPEALYYLQQVESYNDPDIQNQLGVVYTEMRRTDLAEHAYNQALYNIDKSFISTDKTFLKAEILLNYGHMQSYNGNNAKAIELYNQSLQICPQFSLPFQNKLMNLSYLFDELSDKKYILNQHKKINRLYKRGKPFIFESNNLSKINIGIISGDFIEHPVSFFISTFLTQFDATKFNVTCYSECIIDTTLFNSHLKFKFIKNMSAQKAAETIFNDQIQILFDLAGHTAFNRLDVFALKPSPIQISYIGYPYTTGLNEMDYRITDDTCDKLEVSQPFYTEKLITLPNCFLCYNPKVIKRGEKESKIPDLKIQPYIKNKWVTIGCFNRLNKITSNVIKLFNQIMLKLENVRFVFKTKALINKSIKLEFLSKFDEIVHSRISILDCTISHESHLDEYNKIDIAIDTFPYSGTTTSCEALLMGVPVFTLYDSVYYFHPQNVTASILKASDLDFYIANSTDELISKIEGMQFLDENLKINIRSKFLNGKVCNQELYMTNFNELLQRLVKFT